MIKNPLYRNSWRVNASTLPCPLCGGYRTAAWLAVNRTIDDIDDQNQKILESRPQTEDFTDPGEVDAEQNGVTISSEGEDSSSDASSSQEPAAQAQRRFSLIGAAEHIGSAVLAARSR